jgi:hypothetical protein
MRETWRGKTCKTPSKNDFSLLSLLSHTPSSSPFDLSSLSQPRQTLRQSELPNPPVPAAESAAPAPSGSPRRPLPARPIPRASSRYGQFPRSELPQIRLGIADQFADVRLLPRSPCDLLMRVPACDFVCAAGGGARAGAGLRGPAAAASWIRLP